MHCSCFGLDVLNLNVRNLFPVVRAKVFEVQLPPCCFQLQPLFAAYYLSSVPQWCISARLCDVPSLGACISAMCVCVCVLSTRYSRYRPFTDVLWHFLTAERYPRLVDVRLLYIHQTHAQERPKAQPAPRMKCQDEQETVGKRWFTNSVYRDTSASALSGKPLTDPPESSSGTQCNPLQRFFFLFWLVLYVWAL